ncbi:Predicted ATP-binding protein involved in virulence [Methylobacterium sp. UNC378MF]|uniref:AAA family ATPase n=1 Tax=Methylobacterium sp. UNC378MF TaxID=1502748 RepID=UPI00087E0E6B|nr:AAA family ATPase [Methylobacterium sp. UNC378MF]SDA34258.1 Predicted ATP-binding protein involved in virulence [Methylobacterium sp. UNC378MF]
MKITRLSLDNVRAFDEAEFSFNPGFNLIIGINGAGKSTALDAIRFCGSHLLSAVQRTPFKPFGFAIDDIHGDAPFAEASLHVSFYANTHSKIIGDDDDDAFVRLREWRTQFATDNVENVDLLRRRIIETTRPNKRLRSQLRDLHETITPADPTYFYPSKEYFINQARNEFSAPLMIHYSTARSIMNEQAERKSAAGTSQLAYVNALQSNALSLRQFADWMRAQIVLASERPASRHLVDGISAALERFLPGYSNLRPSNKSKSRVEIDINGTTLDVRQLSDGERSVLALILDIAKRLAQANPRLSDPLTSAEAVILIDEIDLHLHPQWQRKIVGNLEKTFPSCQFIASTHSPQVIGEVPHEKIQMIKDGKVYLPSRSFGVDSSRVLEEVMDTKARNAGVEDAIGKIAKLIGDGKADEAKEAIKTLSDEIGEDDPEITRARTLLDFMEGDA